jgi:hypothetical protein
MTKKLPRSIASMDSFVDKMIHKVFSLSDIVANIFTTAVSNFSFTCGFTCGVLVGSFTNAFKNFIDTGTVAFDMKGMLSGALTGLVPPLINSLNFNKNPAPSPFNTMANLVTNVLVMTAVQKTFDYFYNTNDNSDHNKQASEETRSRRKGRGGTRHRYYPPSTIHDAEGKEHEETLAKQREILAADRNNLKAALAAKDASREAFSSEFSHTNALAHRLKEADKLNMRK